MRVSIVTIAIAASAPVMAANPLGDQRPAVRPVLSKPAVEISTGFEYQEGKYGTGQKVETISIPTSVRVTTGRFQFSATLPYVRIDAPGNVVGGGGVLGLPILIDPNQTATRTRREGLGDLKLGAAYTVPSTIVGLSLLGQVKLPTASNVDNLGTGETDYSLGAELSKRLGGVIPFIGVSYTIPGVPKGYDLRNSLSLRGGIATMLSPQVRGYISYGHSRSASRLLTNEKQISTGVNAGLSDRLSLGVFSTAGLSQGSPDIGAGVQLGMRIF